MTCDWVYPGSHSLPRLGIPGDGSAGDGSAGDGTPGDIIVMLPGVAVCPCCGKSASGKSEAALQKQAQQRKIRARESFKPHGTAFDT
jgi:hypothetical protein